MTVAEKKERGIYVSNGQWKAMTDKQKASHVQRAIRQIKKTGRAEAPLRQVGTAKLKSGATRPVYLRPGKPRKLGKFKKTGVKGKNLSGKHYQTVLKSVGRGRGTSRRFTSGGGTTMVGHDFVGTLVIDVGAGEADLVMSISVNPVDLGFPALTVESQLHQQYVFEEFAVHMMRSGTDFLTGDMLGWYDRDPDEALPPGIEGIQVGWFKDGTSAAFKDGHVWHMPRFPGLPVLYTRDLSSDERLVNQSQFNLQIINPPSVFNGGEAEQVELPVEFWASYVCKFMVKDITFNANQDFPRNHVFNNQTGTTANYEGKGLGGVFMLAADFSGVSTDVEWFKNQGEYGTRCCGLPGMVWGYVHGGPILGMLSGYGYNKAEKFQVLWSSTKAAKLLCAGLNTSDSTFTNCSVIAGLARNAPYCASSDFTSNTQQAQVWVVTVDNPGEVQTPPWQSDDKAWFVDFDGSVQQLPYDATREIIWFIQPVFVDTGTSTLTLSAENQYLDVALEQTETFGLLSPAVTPGPATIEGHVREKWGRMTNDEKSVYKGKWQNFLHHVREKRKEQKRKPLPDWLQGTLALEDGKVVSSTPTPSEAKDPPVTPAGPAPTGLGKDIEDFVPVGRPLLDQQHYVASRVIALENPAVRGTTRVETKTPKGSNK
jgi:hypothetical protein